METQLIFVYFSSCWVCLRFCGQTEPRVLSLGAWLSQSAVPERLQGIFVAEVGLDAFLVSLHARFIGKDSYNLCFRICFCLTISFIPTYTPETS